MVETTALVALLWYVFAVQVWSASSGMRLKPRLCGRPAKSLPGAISIAERQAA